MATKQRGKRSFPSSNKSPVAGDEVLNLFVDAPPDGSGEDSDSTDSEESDYSGLEEEEETSDEEASDVESIEEGSSSDDGEEQDENGVEEASASDEDMEEEQISKDSEDSEDETNNNLFTPKPIQKKSKTKRKQKNSQKLDKKDNANKTNPVKNDNEPAAPSGSKKVSSTKTGDEYDVDSSDEEDIRNTVGNIPMEWYKEFSHIGYDLDGKQIIKPKSADELDQFLDKMDNPNYWRTVKDKSTGQRVVLSDKDVDFIQRLKKGKYVDSTYNPYQPWVDFFTHETMKHPLTNHPAQKRSFIPSLWEKQKVSKIVHAIKMGWMKPKPPATEEEEEHIYYNLWENDDQDDITKRLREHIPAPKMILPGHEESYNPPPEYLMTEEEKLIWKEQEKEERKLNFIPQKFSSLRQVPAFSRFINERFERCLDLYLCPRQRKMRMNVNPEDLLPKLPKPKDLQPFPTTQSVVYKGHEAMVRSISVDPTGQWLLSGCDDSTVKVWEVSTGRCLKTFQMSGTVRCVAWNPNPGLCLIAAIVENELILINPEVGDKLVLSNTDNMVNSYEEPEDDSKLSKLPVEWEEYDGDKQNDGFRLKIKHPKKCTSVVWHGRGDYLAVVLPEGESMSVLIHQVSQRRTQNPFRKPKGLVQSVVFHPTRPFFFVATQRYVRVYNLLKQELTKKLMTNVKWVSCMAVHPGGDNVIIGSYDCRAAWFDLDLSSKPYQTLRHHKKAIRQVCYHKRYPLFASASDDGTVIVCHGKVFSDLLQNPMIVPVKVLRGHTPTKDLGVLDCEFHPTQPWIFSSGSDHTIRLFT